jgi:beta-xylosidase
MKRGLLFILPILLVLSYTINSEDNRGLNLSVKQLNQSYSAGKQYLLLIAIDRYQSWPALRNPVKDAREIKDILVSNYYIDEVIELYDGNATKANIIKTFEGLQKRLQVNDSLLVYYAGHGHLDQTTNSGFWIPVNAGTDKYEQANWLPNTQVRGLLSNIRAIHLLVLSDSCFSGDLLNASRGLPEEINNAYFAKAYSLISRQLLSSGASESVPDESEFSRMLKMVLLKNTSPYLDPLMLYNEVRLGVRGSLPMYGNLRDTGYQDGASFLLFRKTPEKQEKTEEPPKIVKKEETTTVTNKTTVEPALDKGEFLDNFDGPTLDSRWHWVRENPAMWSLKERPGSLKIKLERGDLWQSYNDNKNMLLMDPESSDFQIDTKLEFDPGYNSQQAGIVVYQNDDNFVKLDFICSLTNDVRIKKIEMSIEKNASVQGISKNFGKKVIYLRIIKKGDKYHGLLSDDGVQFTLVGEFNNALGDKVKVGLFAFNSIGNSGQPLSQIPAYFDYFRLSNVIEETTTVTNKTTVEPALEKGEFLDNFNGPTLNSRWQWVRENPAMWSLKDRPGSLMIKTEPGELWESQNDNKNMLLMDAELSNFQIDTKLEFDPLQKYQQAGIVVYQNDNNYVKLIFYYNGYKNISLANEKHSSCQYIDKLSMGKKEKYLRIIKKGEKYQGFFSDDGAQFTLVAEYSNSLGDKVKVGLVAFNGNDAGRSASNIPAYFDYFRLSNIK